MWLCDWHVDGELVASTPTDARESYARVASGAFDNGPAGFQEPALFGVFDNIERGAVFDAATGVLELGFSEDGARGIGGEGVEFYEGSVADCFLENR